MIYWRLLLKDNKKNLLLSVNLKHFQELHLTGGLKTYDL